MPNLFSPQELLRIAIRVEENGAKFYGALEIRATDAKIKSVWKYLKEQDDRHRNIFQDMLDNIGDYVDELYPGQDHAYIHAIAQEYIFTPELIAEKSKTAFATDREAVDFGIFIEKESIFTYSAFRGYLLTAKQLILDKIIEEEKNHLVQLVELKLFLIK